MNTAQLDTKNLTVTYERETKQLAPGLKSHKKIRSVEQARPIPCAFKENMNYHG